MNFKNLLKRTKLKTSSNTFKSIKASPLSTINGATTNTAKMEFLILSIAAIIWYKKELSSRSHAKSNFKTQMTGEKENYSKDRISIQGKSKEKKDFTLDSFTSSRAKKSNGCKIETMTPSIYQS